MASAPLHTFTFTFTIIYVFFCCSVDQVAHMSSVVVAKMDADAHTPPEEFQLESYPTLLFLKVCLFLQGVGVVAGALRRPA